LAFVFLAAFLPDVFLTEGFLAGDFHFFAAFFFEGLFAGFLAAALTVFLAAFFARDFFGW
jgi:hypothetical protein